MSKMKDLVFEIIECHQAGYNIRQLVILFGISHTEIIEILSMYNTEEVV